jgi:hypothetical protein
MPTKLLKIFNINANAKKQGGIGFYHFLSNAYKVEK